MRKTRKASDREVVRGRCCEVENWRRGGKGELKKKTAIMDAMQRSGRGVLLSSRSGLASVDSCSIPISAHCPQASSSASSASRRRPRSTSSTFYPSSSLRTISRNDRVYLLSSLSSLDFALSRTFYSWDIASASFSLASRPNIPFPYHQRLPPSLRLSFSYCLSRRIVLCVSCALLNSRSPACLTKEEASYLPNLVNHHPR